MRESIQTYDQLSFSDAQTPIPDLAFEYPLCKQLPSTHTMGTPLSVTHSVPFRSKYGSVILCKINKNLEMCVFFLWLEKIKLLHSPKIFELKI